MNDNPSQAARVAVAWTIVGIPLVYGLANAVKAAAQLFTG